MLVLRRKCPIGVIRGKQMTDDANVGLRRSRLVERGDASLVHLRKRGKRDLRRRAGLPAGEILLQGCLDLSHRDVAGDGDEGVVGAVPGVVELAQVVAGDSAHRLDGAARGLTEGMLVAVEEARRFVGGDRAGDGELLRETGDLQAAHPLEVLGPEGRVLQHVGEDLERLGERLLEEVEMDPARLRSRACAERDRLVLQLLCELGGGALLRTLGQHARNEAREARLAVRLGVDPAGENNVDCDEGQRVVLAHQQARSIRELAIEGNGRVELGLHRKRRRLLRAERRVGGLAVGDCGSRGHCSGCAAAVERARARIGGRSAGVGSGQRSGIRSGRGLAGLGARASEERGTEQGDVCAPHRDASFFPALAGTTSISMRRSSGNHFFANACTDCGVTAR